MSEIIFLQQCHLKSIRFQLHVNNPRCPKQMTTMIPLSASHAKRGQNVEAEAKVEAGHM